MDGGNAHLVLAFGDVSGKELDDVLNGGKFNLDLPPETVILGGQHRALMVAIMALIVALLERAPHEASLPSLNIFGHIIDALKDVYKRRDSGYEN